MLRLNNKNLENSVFASPISFKAFLLVSALAVPNAALAQTGSASGQDQGAQVEMIGDIVVTAQRRSERLRDVPLTISAQNAEMLLNAGVSNLRELGVAVPGLNFTTNGTFAQPTIRGVQTTVSQAGADSPVAIYVDGLYQSNQLGNLFDLPDIERVEVLKGPQGTLFGRNATAGAVVIHTRDPEFKTSGYVEATGARYISKEANDSNAFGVRGFLTTPLSDTLAVSVSGFYEHVDGYLNNLVTGEGTGRINKWDLRGKVLWQPSSVTRLIFTASYGKRRDDAAAATTPLNGNSSARFYPDAIVPNGPYDVASELAHGVSPARDSHLMLSLRTEFEIEGAGTLSTTTGYTRTNARTTADVEAAYSPSCLAAFGCILYDLGYPSRTWQHEMIFASEPFGPVSFTTGLFLYHDRAFQISNINPPLRPDGSIDRSVFSPVYIEGRIRTQALAAFGEANLQVTDRLKLIGGVRYSWEEKEGMGRFAPTGDLFRYPTTGVPSWTSWTPRFSVLFEATPEINLYATYSKGFKSGVLDATALTDDVADPENLSSIEAGLKFAKSGLRFNLSAFHYNYKNLQQQFFNGQRTILANAANAKLYGLEFDGNVVLGGGLDLSVSGSWLPHAKFKDFVGATAFALPNSAFGMPQVVIDASDSRMLKAPKFTGTVALHWAGTIGGGEADVNLNAYYSSKLDWDLLRRVQTKEYVLLNASIGYRPAGGPLRFEVYGKNLTDVQYIGGTVLAANADAVVYAPPRQIGLRGRYEF